MFDPQMVLRIHPKPDDEIGGQRARVVGEVLKDLILNTIEAHQAVACAYPNEGTVVLHDPGYERLGQTVLRSNGAHGLCPGAGDPKEYQQAKEALTGRATWRYSGDWHLER